MMQKNRFIFPAVLLWGSIFIIINACKHEPLQQIDPPNVPTGAVCDPSVVYFQNQVLPILISNCTESGCHNPQDHEEGIVLSSYESVMSTVKHIRTTDWSENKLIESLLESDIEDRMPLNKPPLNSSQINLIKRWIEQGALNNACNESAGVCDSIGGATYTLFISPLIQAKCKGCHSGSNPQGGIKLSTYAEIKTQALSGRLYDSVTRPSNWMPKGGAMLDDCSMVKLKNWIDAGAQEN
jgi:hypothetical protein